MRLELADLLRALEGEVLSGGERDSVEVSYGIASDLMSDVMKRGSPGVIWVTVQSHINAVAVALLVEASALVVADGASVEPSVVEKARERGLTLIRTPLPAFEAVGRLYSMGVRGLRS